MRIIRLKLFLLLFLSHYFLGFTAPKPLFKLFFKTSRKVVSTQHFGMECFSSGAVTVFFMQWIIKQEKKFGSLELRILFILFPMGLTVEN